MEHCCLRDTHQTVRSGPRDGRTDTRPEMWTDMFVRSSSESIYHSSEWHLTRHLRLTHSTVYVDDDFALSQNAMPSQRLHIAKVGHDGMHCDVTIPDACSDVPRQLFNIHGLGRCNLDLCDVFFQQEPWRFVMQIRSGPLGAEMATLQSGPDSLRRDAKNESESSKMS